MIHVNQAIVCEVGATSYMQTTQSSSGQDAPPVMSPINSQDNNGGNLVQDLTPSVQTNTELKSGLSSIMSKIWFIVKIACLVIVLFLALSIFGVGKMKHKKDKESSGEKSKAKDYAEKGIIALLVFWLVKKFFGKDIKEGMDKVNDKLHHKDNVEQPAENNQGMPPRRDSMDNAQNNNADNFQQEDKTMRGVPPRRDIPPRRNPPQSPPPRRNIPPRAVPDNSNKIPPRNTDLWGDSNSNPFDDSNDPFDKF